MPQPRVAYFVSTHGFGHATRSAAIIAALSRVKPDIHFDVFTGVDSWVFQESLSASLICHRDFSDTGMFQSTPLDENLDRTMMSLHARLPFEDEEIDKRVEKLRDSGAQLVICDIAPIGILVAKRLGVPSVLVENFRWDWIFEGYGEESFKLARFTEYLRPIFEAADYLIQAEPVCDVREASLTIAPISRAPQMTRAEVRERLSVSEGESLVMITWGGVPKDDSFEEMLNTVPNVVFVVPGERGEVEFKDNLRLLPYHSEFYHPDLVNASDAVVGKVGYSTVAEVYHAGVPFGYIPRPRFRESPVLERFIENKMSGLPIEPGAFYDGSFLAQIPRLIGLGRGGQQTENGSQQAAEFLAGLL